MKGFKRIASTRPINSNEISSKDGTATMNTVEQKDIVGPMATNIWTLIITDR